MRYTGNKEDLTGNILRIQRMEQELLENYSQRRQSVTCWDFTSEGLMTSKNVLPTLITS